METLIREATDWFLIILLPDDREGFMTAIYMYIKFMNPIAR